MLKLAVSCIEKPQLNIIKFQKEKHGRLIHLYKDFKGTVKIGYTTLYMEDIPLYTWRIYHSIHGGYTTLYMEDIPLYTWRITRNNVFTPFKVYDKIKMMKVIHQTFHSVEVVGFSGKS